MSDVVETKNIKKTRKTHLCDLCLRKIPKGFSCIHNKGISDGEFFNSYLCNTCYKIVSNHQELVTDWWEGYYDPQLLTDLMSDLNCHTPLQVLNELRKRTNVCNNETR